METICNYGCENPGLFKLKNNKWCCSFSITSCPGMKIKNSKKKKGKNPWENKEHPKGMLGKTWKYKGNTYKEIYGESSEEQRVKRSSSIKNYREKLSEEEKKNISEKISKKLTGRIAGPKVGLGRGHKGWYKGIWCDSSYELAYVYDCLEKGLSIRRNTERFPYVWEGVEKGYYPDFIVEEDLVEIKGYSNPQTEFKMSQCTKPLTILREKDLKKSLDSIKLKYGNKFWEVLYNREDGQDGNAADC